MSWDGSLPDHPNPQCPDCKLHWPARQLRRWPVAAQERLCPRCWDARVIVMHNTVAKLPHVWHRKDGRWVRVPVVPGMRYWFHYVDSPKECGSGFATNIEDEECSDDFGGHFLSESDARHALTDPPEGETK